MTHQPIIAQDTPTDTAQDTPTDTPTDFDHHVVLFPTRYAAYLPPAVPTQSAGPPTFGVLPTADGGKVVWARR